MKEQRESNPLVVGDVSPLLLLVGTRLEDAGMSDLFADMKGQRPRDRVGGVDPAVEVEHVVGHIVGVDAVDGVADVLPRRYDDGEREQDHRTDTPVQPEHRRVDVDVADLDKCLEPDEYVQHGGVSAHFRVRQLLNLDLNQRPENELMKFSVEASLTRIRRLRQEGSMVDETW